MSRLRRLGLLALIGLVIWLAVSVILHPYGGRFAIGIWPVPNGTPWTYQLESGFVPALTVVGLFSLIGGAWHHVVCHETGCVRPGRHKVDGTPWCNVHQGEARERREATLADVVAGLHRVAELLERQTPP